MTAADGDVPDGVYTELIGGPKPKERPALTPISSKPIPMKFEANLKATYGKPIEERIVQSGIELPYAESLALVPKEADAKCKKCKSSLKDVATSVGSKPLITPKQTLTVRGTES